MLFSPLFIYVINEGLIIKLLRPSEVGIFNPDSSGILFVELAEQKDIANSGRRFDASYSVSFLIEIITVAWFLTS